MLKIGQSENTDNASFVASSGVLARAGLELRMKKKKGWEDHYTRRARHDKWLARSVYKLKEIDEKYKLLGPGDKLLDLGCYPGSWSQYGAQKIGGKGQVVGIDIKEPDRFSAPNFRFIKADVLALDLEWLKNEIGLRSAVISDLAPQTTGIKLTDTTRSMELAHTALKIAVGLLQRNGHFLCKVFEGEDLKTLRKDASAYFNRIRIARPAAVRKKSKEVYLLGLRFTDSSSGRSVD